MHRLIPLGGVRRAALLSVSLPMGNSTLLKSVFVSAKRVGVRGRLTLSRRNRLVVAPGIKSTVSGTVTVVPIWPGLVAIGAQIADCPSDELASTW